MGQIKEVFLHFRKRNRAIVQTYNIINDVMLAEHGRIFGGDEARERLSRIGIQGERLSQLQRQVHEDPGGMRMNLEKNLLNG